MNMENYTPICYIPGWIYSLLFMTGSYSCELALNAAERLSKSSSVTICSHFIEGINVLAPDCISNLKHRQESMRKRESGWLL